MKKHKVSIAINNLENAVFGALNEEINLTQGDKDQLIARIRMENIRQPMVKAFRDIYEELGISE